jgi:uncharacterized protein YggT (Ycf19 family)
MLALGVVYFFIRTAITLTVVVGVVLVILRAIFDYAQVNPFTWHYRNVRRATDPVMLPARAILRGFRLDPKVAPLVVVIMLIAVWLVLVQTAGSVLNTIAGVLYAATSHRANAGAGIVGYLLFGLLGLFTVVILVRIIFSWVGASYTNRLMRFRGESYRAADGSAPADGSDGWHVGHLTVDCLCGRMGVPNGGCLDAVTRLAGAIFLSQVCRSRF